MLPRIQCEITQYTAKEELSFTLSNVLLDTVNIEKRDGTNNTTGKCN